MLHATLLLLTRGGMHLSRSGLDYNAHFWLGSKTSQDEMTVAAFKTVELDQLLGDKPVQYREVEGSESVRTLAALHARHVCLRALLSTQRVWWMAQTLFTSYFKATGGIVYREGGVASGFHHVDRDAFEPELLHIKGRRNARAKQVPVTVASLNDGDVFLLDIGAKIFLVCAVRRCPFFADDRAVLRRVCGGWLCAQWSGSSSSTAERSKGAELLTRIRNSRGAKAEIVLMGEAL
jgi:hypothetical protein